MSAENRFELNRFEALLSTLTPQPVGIDRDRLMFLAGQASVTSGQFVVPPSGGRVAGAFDKSPPEGGTTNGVAGDEAPVALAGVGGQTPLRTTAPKNHVRWLWPASTAAAVLVAAALGITAWQRPAIQYVDRIAYVAAPSP